MLFSFLKCRKHVVRLLEVRRMYIFSHLSQIMQYMTDVYICTRTRKVYGVLNTVENRTRLPSNLGHTLQHLLPHHTMWELSLFICIGGT